MSDLETLAHEIMSNAECGDKEAVRALLQRYGDTRERAGIERAAKLAENGGWRSRALAGMIRLLSVPAPEPKESEVRDDA